MANYYNYDFVSPEPIYALVKEELKSYFQTGAVDDLLFPIWTDRCLKRLGKGSYGIQQAVLHIKDYESRLPTDFDTVREAWSCHVINQRMMNAPALYQQVTTNITPQRGSCPTCDPCLPDLVEVVYKTKTEEWNQTFKVQYLLKPGNISVRKDCALDCLNYYSSALDSFDIRDGKMFTNVRETDVYMIYYSKYSDDNGYQLVPDNMRIQEYIEFFIKAKVFEMLSNQITDETYNQIAQKKAEYEQKANDAYVNAQIETKKQTIYQRFQAIRRDENRLSMFNIP